MTTTPRRRYQPLRYRLFIGLFFAYMVLGNLPRFISSEESGNTLPITEPVLYCAALVLALVCSSSRRYLVTHYRWVFLALSSSLAYGMVVNGFDAKALVLNLRFQLQLIVALLLGHAFYRTNGRAALSLFRSLLRMFLVVALVSLVIEAIWPISLNFYAFLSEWGIHYVGDPHEWRLISVYLDPNLFGTVAVLPLFFALALVIFGKKPRFLWPAVGFGTVIALTVSRSGAGSAGIFLTLAAVICVRQRYVERRDGLPRLVWLKGSTVVALMFGALAVSVAALPPLLERLEGGVEDEGSALLRYESFVIGMEAIEQHPLMGMGYNYGYTAGLARTMASENVGTQVGLDSSIQLTVINFGLIPSTLLAVLFVVWCVRVRRHLARLHQMLFAYYLAYVVTVILFASQFNNLLYYQFWLIPVVALGTYFSQLAHASAPEQRARRLAAPRVMQDRAPAAATFVE